MQIRIMTTSLKNVQVNSLRSSATISITRTQSTRNTGTRCVNSTKTHLSSISTVLSKTITQTETLFSRITLTNSSRHITLGKLTPHRSFIFSFRRLTCLIISKTTVNRNLSHLISLHDLSKVKMVIRSKVKRKNSGELKEVLTRHLE